MQLRNIIASAALLIPVAGLAGERGTPPLEVLKNQTDAHFVLCQVTAMQGALRLDLPGEETSFVKENSNISSCLREAKAKLRPDLTAALKVAAKRKALSDAVKDYYVSWTKSLNALSMKADDTRDSHLSRIQEAERSYKDVWERVSLEASL